MKHALLVAGIFLSIVATSHADYGYATSVDSPAYVRATVEYYGKLVWTAPSTPITQMQVTISAPDGTVVAGGRGGMGVGGNGSSGYVSSENSFIPTQVGTYTITFNGQDANGINVYG